MTSAGIIMIWLVIAAGSPFVAQAQPPGISGGRMYDPSTVETVKGEVARIDQVPSPGGRGRGIHAALKTGEATVTVHLGPAWYLDKQKISLSVGNQVEIEGSRVTFGGKSVIVARVVKKDDQTWILRDAAGIPAWAGSRGSSGRRRPR